MKAKDIRRSIKRAMTTMGFPVGSSTLFVLAAFFLLTDESTFWQPFLLDVKAVGQVLLACGTLALMTWGAFAFTGNPYMRRTHEVGFAYSFVIISLLVFAAPALVVSHAVGFEPIGLISGCVRDIRASEQVRCQQRSRPGEQDVLAGQGTQPARQGDAPPGGKAGEPVASAALSGDQSVQSGQQAAQSGRQTRNQWLVNIGGTLEPQGPARECGTRAPQGQAPGSGKAGPADPIDPGCRPGSPRNPAFVSGGLVLPLPYLLIALAGGAISLTRRIPEIQRCSETDHVPTDALPRLSGGAVRERLMFQILQFISSPLVALVAYQVIQPESDATAAGLAFMSGFGSEAILQRMRDFMESAKAEAKADRPATVGIVQGIVRRRQRGVENVEVRLNGSTIRTRSGQAGLYVLSDLPPGRQALSVTYGAKVGLYPVHVLAGKVTTRMIDLAEDATEEGGASGPVAANAAPAAITKTAMPAQGGGGSGTYGHSS